MVLGLDVTVSLLDAIMAAVGVLIYDGAIVAIIIMLFRLLRRGDRQDRTVRKVVQRVWKLEQEQESQQLLDRGPSIPRMPRMPRMPGWRRRNDDPGRSDSFGDLNMGGDDSYPPNSNQQRVEQQIRRSHGPQIPQPPRSRPTAPPLSPESSDGRWDFYPEELRDMGLQRERPQDHRTSRPLTHWQQGG